jgi:hypothetical protein
MMRMLWRIFLQLVISVMTVSMLWAASDQRDFRQTTWGMNSSQIVSAEGKQPVFQDKRSSIQMLGYSDQIANLNCNVIYILAYDQLVRTKYRISEKHTNNTEYLSDYDRLKEGLSTKYGKPVSDTIHWKDNLYKSDPSHWGMAVAVGHMVKFTRWENPRTIIILYLTGDNFEIDLGIEYSSKELRALEEKAKKEQDASKF